MPVVSNITPNAGITAGDYLTFVGTGFGSDCTVDLAAGTSCGSVTSADPTNLVCRAPAGSPALAGIVAAVVTCGTVTGEKESNSVDIIYGKI